MITTLIVFSWVGAWQTFSSKPFHCQNWTIVFLAVVLWVHTGRYKIREFGELLILVYFYFYICFLSQLQEKTKESLGNFCSSTKSCLNILPVSDIVLKN